MTMLQDRSILVVDDEELLREILRDEFELQGATVSTASNGVEALDILKTTEFDAVLADLRMPGGDGLTLIHQINRRFARRPLIFLCTGFADLSDEESAGLGISAVFNKPFRRETLVRTMSAALSAIPLNTLPNSVNFEKF